MRIIYIHQYFKTPEQGGAIRSYYIASALAQKGHEIELITAHNKKDYTVIDVNGVQVHYLPIAYLNRFGSIRRIWSFMLFTFRSIRLIQKLPRPDLFYITSTPLTTGLIGLFVKRMLKLPFIFEVRDLWPEAPIQMGYFKDPLSRHLLAAMEKKIYDGADKIIGLSPGIITHIRRIAPKKKLHFIPNMSDCDFFNPPPRDYSFDNIPGRKFTVAYTGAVGMVNELEHLLRVAGACQDKQLPVKFVVAGDGSRFPSIRKKANGMSLHNVEFLGHINKEEIKSLLDRSDAVYISFKKIPVLETNSPNKFFDGLAAGKICITNTRGWLKDLIESSECGFYADPESPEQFVEKINGLINDPLYAKQCGQNARKLAEGQFSLASITEQVAAVIENNKRPKPASKESAYTLTH